MALMEGNARAEGEVMLAEGMKRKVCAGDGGKLELKKMKGV
jgi:hypothetical protein